MQTVFAAVQMYAVPFAVPRNLRRARDLVQQAVAQGARLVVLPELFNTGYTYSEAAFDYAEPLDGLTATWLCDGARRLDCYLAGALLVRYGSDVYSTMLLATPHGTLHTYRKRHPFFWERSICREGNPARPAETPLGRVGMLVCADVAYPDSYAAYAGQVDCIIASSTAAALAEGTVDYTDGSTIALTTYNRAFAGRASQMRYDYFEGIGERAAALKAPIVHAVQCGSFRSPLPAERLSVLASLIHCPQRLVLQLKQGLPVLSTHFLGHSAIFDGQGHLLAVQAEGEGVIVAPVTIGGDVQEMMQSAFVV